MTPEKPRHLQITEPSPWIIRFAPLIEAGGSVLDLACGGGRHGRYLLDRGYQVTFVDRDISAIGNLENRQGAQIIEADLEQGDDIFSGLLAGRRFDGIVVSNYLFRPLLGPMVAALNPGGVLIYETFGRGNERFSRPRNPDHLLISGELLERVGGHLQVLAYESGIIDKGPLPGVIQRICAIAETEPQPLDPL